MDLKEELDRDNRRLRMRLAVSYLQSYMGTYTKQYNYEDYADETLINDVLYGLGVALGGEEHKFADGFKVFRQKLVEHLKEG